MRRADRSAIVVLTGLSLAVLAASTLAQEAPARSPYGVLVRSPFTHPSQTPEDVSAGTRPLSPTPSPVGSVASAPAAPSSDEVALAASSPPMPIRVAPAPSAARDGIVGGGIEQILFGPAVDGADHDLRVVERVAARAPPSPDETLRLKGLARRLLGSGAVAQARALLDPAAEAGDAEARYLLAQTYDPDALARLGAVGTAGDPARAGSLYDAARRGGYPGPGPQADAYATTRTP